MTAEETRVLNGLLLYIPYSLNLIGNQINMQYYLFNIFRANFPIWLKSFSLFKYICLEEVALLTILCPKFTGTPHR